MLGDQSFDCLFHCIAVDVELEQAGIHRGARTFVRLFVGHELGIRQQAVLEIIDADLSRFAITDRTKMAADFQSALVSFFHGGA